MNAESQAPLAWKFRFDDSGLLISLCGPSGRTTQFDYDFFSGEARRVKSVSRRCNGSLVVSEFDQLGRRTRRRDSAGTVDFTWTKLGQFRSARREGGPLLGCDYDALGRLVRQSIEGISCTEYRYDFMGRLEAMDTRAGTIRYEYWTGQGKVVRILPNGVQTFWTYQVDGRLAEISHVDPRGYLIAKFTYDYRPDSLIAGTKESSPQGERQLRFEYDAVQRLIGLSDEKGGIWRAEYDPMGNRIKGGFQGEETGECRYDWAGRILLIGGIPCQHDAAGNLVSATLNGVARHFEFDHENRLCKAGEIVYEYDGDGYLIARAVRGRRTTYLPDPTADIWRPLLETHADGRQRLYVWEDRTPLAAVEDGKPLFFLHDHLGSVRCVADAAGAVVEQRDYSAFGVCATKLAGNDLTPGFASLFWDAGAGLYLTRARGYFAELGRFVQTDPQHGAPPEGQIELSFFAYCSCDPVNNLDLDGARHTSISQTWRNAVLWTSEFCKTFESGIQPLLDGSWSRYWIGQGKLDSAREGVVREVYDQALTTAGGDATMAHLIAKNWREGRQSYPGNLILTPNEWQAVENGLYAQHLVEKGVGILPAGELSALAVRTFLIPGWGLSHVYGEEFGVPPDAFLSASGYGRASGRWLPQDKLTIRMQFEGVNNALAHLRAVAAAKALTAKGEDSSRLLSVPVARNRTDRGDRQPLRFSSFGGPPPPPPPPPGGGGPPPPPSPPPGEGLGTGGTGWRNWGGPILADGVIASTTGPAKRGGRGGGITRPPSWNPPWKPPVGPKPKPGGKPPPGRSGGWGGRTSLSPSPVGGIYLGGAGRCVDGIGQLSGVAVDQTTGNLVLLTKRNGEIDLPPLRLDDVVIIFRSVYLHGEGPSVSIDPQPGNPHGPVMNVVHGKATPDTYVGWVLFEADRIMKGYGEGEDNVSRQRMASAAPGYDKVLETVYFGGDFGDGTREGGNWERFWIVPAEVTRYRAASGELTLFDVPLKVETQKMVLRKGKLEDDSNGKSSKGALAFIEWFTRHFESIAQEQYLQPPPESGLTEPVPIYAELHRIALTTAIAEQLRDQGVPMPFWMRDYPVRRIPFAATTPSLTTTREKQEGARKLTARIFGGVNLSPADSVVKNIGNEADVARLPAPEREANTKELAAANSLAPAVAGAAAAQPPLTPFAVSTPEREVTAVSVPGAESTALAPCRLSEVDLEVAGEGGVRLSLMRHFNSFFRPNGELGAGWTLDLPRLDRAIVPTERTDYGGKSVTVPELLTPLNTLYARFSRDEAVPQLGVRLHVPDKPCEILALAGANSPLVPAAKSKVIFRDGRSWLFDAEGRFVAEEAKPVTTVYRRDEVGRVARISGYHGDRETAVMRLDYDGQGRLRAAIPLDLTKAMIPYENEKQKGLLASLFGGHRKTEPAEDPGEIPEGGVAFDYDENGMLASVTTPDDRVTYIYQNGLVVGVSRVPKGDDAANAQPRIRKFEYSANGQLAAEITPDGTRISYDVRQHEGKHQVCIGTEGAQVVADYDPANRPLAVREADGTQTAWQYAEDGAVTAETALPTGESSRMTLSGDRRQRTVSTSEGPEVREGLDDAGRTVKFSVEKTPAVGEPVPATLSGADMPMEDVFTQQWRPDGLPGTTHFTTQAIIPEYDEHGRVTRVIWVKPTGSDRFSEWQETRFDDAGRVTEVKDCTRGKVAIGYDADSNIVSVTTTRVGAEQQEEQVSYAFTRDGHGRITGVNSPGGRETCEYDASGSPATVLVRRGQAEARIEFSEGRLKRLIQFDGGRIEFDYTDEGPAKGQLRTVHTPVVKLNYRYNADEALAEVVCGDACRVIYGYDGNGNLASIEYCPAAGS